MKLLRVYDKFYDKTFGHFIKPDDENQKEKWSKLHEKGYHPSIKDSIERIKNDRDRNYFVLDRYSKILGIDIDVKNKIVLEIGFGGGWYLAQALFRNASKVIGFEVSKNIIDQATETFESLGLKNYSFHEVDQDYLKIIPKNTVDIIFQITVFCHISLVVTRNYILSAYNILKDDGMFYCQFLINDDKPKKNPYAKNAQGINYYSHNEVLKLVENCNLTVKKFGDEEERDENGGYWRIYLLQK